MDRISDLDDAEKNETPLTPQEQLQQELFNIEIDVMYAYASAELQYNFRNLPDYKVKVTHLLLEAFAECPDRELVVVKAIPPESSAALKISPQNFKYFSSRLILSTTYKGEEVEADLCVELPADFYDARSNLRELAAFRLAGDQLIQELLDLADFPFPGGSGGGGNGIPPDDATLQVWAEKIHLERYLLRLFRMKKHDPALFAQRLKRLTNVIADLKASDVAQLKALGNTLGELKSVIAK